MGSHKGYGLAVAVEILSCGAAGLAVHGGAPARRERRALLPGDRPRRFRDEGEFEADLDGMIDSLHACRTAAIRASPCSSRATRSTRPTPSATAPAFPLSRSVIEDIRTVARASGVPFILDANG